MTFNPFWHYHARFDAAHTVQRYADATPTPQPREGLVVNFLDVAVDPVIHPPSLSAMAGTVEPAPMPNNWHADLAEWGGALRAVDLSGQKFTMIELGCGWGCWMNNMGVAAKRTGRAVHVIGIEGDKGHLKFAEQALARNGFDRSEWTLVSGIAAGQAGTALFPIQDHAGASWGLEPVFGASEEQTREAVDSGKFEALPMVPLSEVARDHDRIDLLHIDIQGGEVNVIRDCLEVMNEKVAYVLVGTHSRQIEGRLFEIMLAGGWQLDMERAAFITVTGPEPVVVVDGVQGWVNPRFTPT